MAYTFMDDYGTEWTIITQNPFYRHHYWIELTTDFTFDHEVIDGECNVIENEAWPCDRARDTGLSWSLLMSKSDAETEASCYWQFELEEMRLTEEFKKLLESKDTTDDDAMDELMSFWSKYRREEMFKFYKKHPEHPYAQDFLIDYEEDKKELEYHSA